MHAFPSKWRFKRTIKKSMKTIIFEYCMPKYEDLKKEKSFDLIFILILT